MKLYIPGGPPALEAPRSYPSKPITGSYEGHTTVTGTPSPDNPAALTPLRVPDVLGAAKQVGELWSLPNGTKDTYDGEAGLLVRRVGKYEIKGTEPFSDLTELTNVIRFLVRPSNLVAKKEDASSISTHFTKIYSWEDDFEHFYINYNTITFFLPKNLVSAITLDAAKSWFAAQAAAGTPVSILYELARPTVERIVYTGPIVTRSTDVLAPSWTGRTTVTGTPSPDSPATITGVPFAATATGPDGQSQSVNLGITGYSLPDGTADSYDGRTGTVVQKISKFVFSGTETFRYVKTRPIANPTTICFEFGDVLSSKQFNYLCNFFTSKSIWSIDEEGIMGGGSNPYSLLISVLKIRLTDYGYVDGNESTYISAFAAWVIDKKTNDTPLTVYYELEKPIAYNQKADLPAFDGQTTVTGTDAVEVIEGRVLRVADCMPFELVRSNPNLFDNGDFRFPINQRGAFNYIANSNYSIDRWFLWRLDHKGIGSIRLDKNKGITLLCSPGNQVIVEQKVDTLIPNMVYTFAVLCIVNRGSLKLHAFLDDSDLSGFYSTPNITKSGLYFVTGTKKTNAIATLRFFTDTDSNCNITVVAAKLEEGTEQTLARKVGDQWVLNDPPPNYQQEFAKCQQYYISQIGTLCNGYITGAEAQVFVPTPVTMRANPIAEIVFADNIVSPDGVWNVLAITNTVAYKNGVKLNITTNRPSNSARTVCTTASSSFSFSAEL